MKALKSVGVVAVLVLAGYLGKIVGSSQESNESGQLSNAQYAQSSSLSGAKQLQGNVPSNEQLHKLDDRVTGLESSISQILEHLQDINARESTYLGEDLKEVVNPDSDELVLTDEEREQADVQASIEHVNARQDEVYGEGLDIAASVGYFAAMESKLVEMELKDAAVRGVDCG